MSESETLLPTHGVRWVRRQKPLYRYNTETSENEAYASETVLVLQHRFTKPSGVEVWVDVPTTEE